MRDSFWACIEQLIVKDDNNFRILILSSLKIPVSVIFLTRQHTNNLTIRHYNLLKLQTWALESYSQQSQTYWNTYLLLDRTFLS